LRKKNNAKEKLDDPMHQKLSLTVITALWCWWQLYRRAKCTDIVVRVDSPIVRRTILAISGKVVEAAKCKSSRTISGYSHA